MKNILILGLIFSFSGAAAQTGNDSVLLELRKLKQTRIELSDKLAQLKTAVNRNSVLLDSAMERFNGLLVQLDSITGVVNELQAKKQRTAQEEKKWKKSVNLQDSLKTDLERLYVELETLKESHEANIQVIAASEERLGKIDKAIADLERDIPSKQEANEPGSVIDHTARS